LTGTKINWAHLVRNRMKRALRDNAPLPYLYLITNIFDQFEVPIEDEPYEKHNIRNYQIGVEVIHSFGFFKNQNDQ